LKYLKTEGLKNVHYAPHGVNTKEFFPLDKNAIRTRQGFDKQFRKKFIIGVFAKNDERKQLAKIFMAIQYLVFGLKQKNIFLYVHAEVKPNLGTGWDLEFLADHLKIKKHVIFTERNFQPQIGVGLTPSATAGPGKPLSYLERINMCDVIVNVPFSGGFELCNVEAQACGIPVITTDDGGNIKEDVNDSAILLKSKMKSIWTNGAIVHLIDEIDLAHELLRVKSDPLLRQSLREKGLENIKRYSWRLLEKKIEALAKN
jgi:glycosyltransferase involved in cell wall biosynthesis